MSQLEQRRENRGSGRCRLPWILLCVVVLGLAGTIWWGYTKRQAVVEYAVTSMLDQQFGALLPEFRRGDVLRLQHVPRPPGEREVPGLESGALQSVADFVLDDWAARAG